MANSLTGKSVLLVEDDTNLTNSLREPLARFGFQALVASSVWEAFKRIKDSPVDAIIASLSIAENEGMSFRERLTGNPATADTPFIGLVPEGKIDMLVDALRGGVDDCLLKPFEPIILVARLQAALARREYYERLAHHDPLTHLLNRPSVLEEITLELARVRRYEHPATLLLLDLDAFAEVNSNEGYAVGNLLLTGLSSVILQSLRRVDIAGRYCGESFLLCLPDTTEDGGLLVANRIQEMLAKTSRAIAEVDLTFSCGLAVAPRDGGEMPELLPKLQRALERAQEQGGGRVEVWRGES